MMIFKETPEFLKDVKKLSKKIASLEGDLENFKKYLPSVDFDNNKRFVTLHQNKQNRIIKTRLMVRSLKGSSKVRVVFAFMVQANTVTLVEIYMKNNKERENTGRIQNYIKSRS